MVSKLETADIQTAFLPSSVLKSAHVMLDF